MEAMGSSRLRTVLMLLGAGLKQSQKRSVSSPAPVTMVRLSTDSRDDEHTKSISID